MPIVQDVSQRKIVWTGISHNFWGAESAFTEVEGSAGSRRFKWAPNLDHLEESSQGKHAGEDSSALQSGYVSITPLRANFATASSALHGVEFVI
ncbi:hypothetical protein Forpi1262_v002064 [Fusarium oxysporum f. sp. raphani]|uniref:Uncharacterized protein n=1 Tax=Fusarium oxysporum f. sp. raphani TaxID=96318 RepID=A0A8J5QBD7_FUSOX|nr:hypothetical protein Forpi1262_v002064 [Fusarium oxysporum f. sp. raphani]